MRIFGGAAKLGGDNNDPRAGFLSAYLNFRIVARTRTNSVQAWHFIADDLLALANQRENEVQFHGA